jgi:hypothetical protein
VNRRKEIFAVTDTLRLHWPVYEPSNSPGLCLDESDCLQHLLLVGQSGSGKTSFLHRGIAQLLAFNAQDSDRKIGILITDAKDEMSEQILEHARRVGREQDVILIGHGSWRLDLFRVRNLADVEAGVQRLLVGSGPIGSSGNEFWEHARNTMFDAFLTLLAVTEPLPMKFSAAVEFARGWFFDALGSGQETAERISSAQRVMQRLPPAEQRKVQQALDTARLWRSLEARTRSNVQATLIQAARPWTGLAAAKYFDTETGTAFNLSEIADHGKVSLSLPQSANPRPRWSSGWPCRISLHPCNNDEGMVTV